ncbi:MAG: ATP-binding cassette domain-containing protein [Actinobacteria bacterium]|nr:ATP-binding cassette domain-containing protein [Actinomycetota bacterium]
MDNLVSMKNIYMMFGGLCANNNVDIEINKGEVIGLVGDNAAGKSTLMKILAGVYSPTSGEIYFENKPVKFKSPQDSRGYGIEMLFQDLALVPELDVTDNLFLGKEIPIVLFNKLKLKFLLNRNKMKKMSAKFLKELEINVASVDEKVKNLSGGQMQSVAIARAIFFNAKLVILDEPTASISVKETKKVLNLVTQLKQKGISVVIVSHRMEDIFAVADRIIVLKRGTKVKDVERGKTSQEDIIKSIIGDEAKN